MSKRTEDIRGWVGTLVIHCVVALLLFLWKVNTEAQEQDYIEVSWQSSGAKRISSPLPQTNAAATSASAKTSNTSHSFDLPERMLAGPEEAIAIPKSRKLDADDAPGAERISASSSVDGRKDRDAGSFGTKDDRITPGSGALADGIGSPDMTGAEGSGIGNSVGVSMQWPDGGTRKKLSGPLPGYPEDANVEAQIRIETVVTPDGTVRSSKPVQKGNTRLEEAAMSAVRLWKFEPLRKSSPQKDQVCVVTFNFLLK